MLLGHSELRVTADLYTHLAQQTAAKAAPRMDPLLGAPERLGRQLGCQTPCADGHYVEKGSDFLGILEPALGLEPRTC